MLIPGPGPVRAIAKVVVPIAWVLAQVGESSTDELVKLSGACSQRMIPTYSFHTIHPCHTWPKLRGEPPKSSTAKSVASAAHLSGSAGLDFDLGKFCH